MYHSKEGGRLHGLFKQDDSYTFIETIEFKDGKIIFTQEKKIHSKPATVETESRKSSPEREDSGDRGDHEDSENHEDSEKEEPRENGTREHLLYLGCVEMDTKDDKS
jgi:hypothetical protein